MVSDKIAQLRSLFLLLLAKEPKSQSCLKLM